MQKVKGRENEKGAALVTVLLIAMLLLVASAGLILEVTTNSANITDATAEQQAYNAAESGVQSAINVLRGNVFLPDSQRLDTTVPATDLKNRITFRRAVTLGTSNLAGDPSTEPRLSRWMNYDYVPAGTTYGQRITIGKPSDRSYDPLRDYAFDLTVVDPDNTGRIVSYNTVGQIFTKDVLGGSTSKVVGAATITYIPPSAVSNLNVSGGAANTNFGSFQISGGQANITQDLRFAIDINLTAPYTNTRTMRGIIKAGVYNPGQSVPFVFDSLEYDIMGSQIILSNMVTINATAKEYGFYVPVNSSKAIDGTMSSAEPFRLVLRSTGYGPRGAKKVLEATIQKNFFNGMSAPSTLTLVGSSSGFVFNSGNSQNVTYSGDDVASNTIIPSIGTTNNQNLQGVFNDLSGTGWKTNTTGIPANVANEMPFWLQSPTNLDSTIQSLKGVAVRSGSYYASGQTPTSFGNYADATGITFIDGDVSLSGLGGGILVVTGKLTLHGYFRFKGLILVTGPDGVDRRGGGGSGCPSSDPTCEEGTIQGNMVIAPYNKTNPGTVFNLPPKYDMSGGGNSVIRYNSDSVSNGMTAVSNFVLGVAEK